MNDLIILSITAILATAVIGTQSQAANIPGDWATYDMMSTVEKQAPPVSELNLLIGPEEQGYHWWQMSGKKQDGTTFAIRALSDSVPMVDSAPGQIKRYILREGDDRPIEYIDARTGDAYLPKFEFINDLLPQPAAVSQVIDGYKATGTCLGHVLSLAQTGSGREWEKWEMATQIRLNPDEWHYMYGEARDTEGHYIYEGDYHYVPLTKEEMDEIIDLGMNSFLVNDQYEEIVYRRPVFYYKWFRDDESLKYPEVLYRSNFAGAADFIDEPAIHYLGSRDDLDKVKRPEEGALLLSKRVEETWETYSAALRHRTHLRTRLQARGANLGTMQLDDTDHPFWETIIETSYYQLQSGAAGILHECRYQLKDFTAECEKYLGPGLKASDKEMLLVNFAYLRGAARAFGKDWGVSIYGQCDPEVAPEVITLAYDMGARYIWFWSYDHQHHLPHFMKLKLLKHLQEHKKAHPRPALDTLLHAAHTAVVIPYGYGWTPTFNQLWESKHLYIDNKNAAGVSHREVIAAIIASGLACVKNGEDFDYVIDGAKLDGYTRVIKVGLDAQITDSAAAAASPVKLTLKSADVNTVSVTDGSDPAVRIPYVENIQINGDLTKWNNANWITLDKESDFVGWLKPDGKPYQWGGKNDLSASLAFARDENNLYIAAKVKDDKHVQNNSAETIWMGDSIQVALDPRLDRCAAGYASDDIEFGLALTPDGPQAYQWRCGQGLDAGLINDAKDAIKRTQDNTTIYEAAIPWKSMTPIPSGMIDHLGLSFVVNDNDGDTRKGYLQLTPGIAEQKIPAQFAHAYAEPIPASKLPDLVVLLDDSRRTAADSRNWILALDSLCPTDTKCKLEVRLTQGIRESAIGSFTLALPTGRSRCMVNIDTNGLNPGIYKCHLKLSSGHETLTEAEMPVYILK